MSRAKRLIVALGIAGLIAAGTALTAGGLGDTLPRDWAMSCVELNDLIEKHRLYRLENVGIYQAVHGDNAEIACQSDHRDDVQALFHWAFRPIEELSPIDPRYRPISPTVLGDIHSAPLIGRIEHTANEFGDLTLSKGKYVAVINWWDIDERTHHQTFSPWIYSNQLGLVAWSINLASSKDEAGSAHIQFEVHGRSPVIWIQVGEQSYTKWTVEFFLLR